MLFIWASKGYVYDIWTRRIAYEIEDQAKQIYGRIKMTWIEELQQFSSNGGPYHKGVSPQWGEPYYEIVNQKMLKRKFKPGDKVRIAVKRSDTDDPTVFDDVTILCFGEKMLECLTKGEKEHENRENVDHFFKNESSAGFRPGRNTAAGQLFPETRFYQWI